MIWKRICFEGEQKKKHIDTISSNWWKEGHCPTRMNCSLKIIASDGSFVWRKWNSSWVDLALKDNEFRKTRRGENFVSKSFPKKSMKICLKFVVDGVDWNSNEIFVSIMNNIGCIARTWLHTQLCFRRIYRINFCSLPPQSIWVAFLGAKGNRDR